MAPVKLKVSTHQQEYYPGSVVEGTVEVEVCTKNDKESSADDLMFELVGQTNTRVVYYTGSGDNRRRHEAKETKEFLSYKMKLADFDGKAASGLHSFPFSVTLPEDLPPSMQGGYAHQKDEWSIEYRFNAHLDRPGFLNFDAKGSSVLTVLGTPQQLGPPEPLKAGPITMPVKFCCCFNRGSMSLGFKMERSTAAINESLGLAVAARNDSSKSVNHLTIELKQEIVWSAKGHSSTQETTLASVIVPRGSELAGFQWTKGSGPDDAHGVAPVEDNAQNDLQQQLDKGGGTRFLLAIPFTTAPNLDVENVKISHSVGVTVDTECCIGEPCVWAPLVVVKTAAAPRLLPGATSLASPQALTNLPPQTGPYLAGPYGSAPNYQHPNNPPSGMTYSAAQTVPYPNINPPTYGSLTPGFAPTNVQYPSQRQALSYSGVEMDEYGHAKPVSVPQTAG